MKKAGKITALSCIRGLGEIKMEETLVRDRKWVKKLFGFEGILADRNLSRNKQSYKATIRSLALGMMLILSTGSLREQMSKMQEYMMPKTQEIMINYCSSRKRNINVGVCRQIFKIYHCPSNLKAIKTKQCSVHITKLSSCVSNRTAAVIIILVILRCNITALN